MMEAAVILSGGKSSRMGQNKALLDLGGEPLIERVYRILKPGFRQVAISANDPETYAFLGIPVIRDVFEVGGSLAGIHAGLLHFRTKHCFFAACDMPFLNLALVRYLGRLAEDFDVVIPSSRNGPEPLHSFYSRDCVPYIEQMLEVENLKIIDLFPHVRVREVGTEEMQSYDPQGLSYFNINTPEKYESAKDML
jgi:molybdopterin-guanine dinucleotide biosynthesis protein A